MSTNENPYLSGSNGEKTKERSATARDQTPAADPELAEAVRQLSQRESELGESVEEIVTENNELREQVEALREDNEELRERLEEVEAVNERLREEKADSERVSALEGDFSCPSCDRQVHASQVTEAYQEESGDGGLLGGSSFEGPVTDVRCPHCGEKVDVTDNLSERERVRVTNELREVGVASGEIVDVDEAVDDEEDE